MGIGKLADKRKYLTYSAYIAKSYLLIKVHKPDHPGRLVVCQIDDPSYKICEILTKILNPFDEAADSFIVNAKHLKDELKKIKLDEECIMGSYNVRNLYPSVPIKKTLEITKKQVYFKTTKL